MPVAQWLGHLPGGWVLALTGLAMVIEAGLLVGLMIPGTTLLLTLGILTQLGVVPLAASLATAVAATVLGAQLGFWRGTTTGVPLTRLVERPLGRAAGLVARHGGRAVVIGHWSSFGRNLVPRLAAAGRMPYKTFATAVVPSGALWATAMVLIGYTQAAALQHYAGLAGPCVAVVLVVALIWTARRRGSSPGPARPGRHPAR
ncbi:DedA family protein [Nonomuraea soli]|uniref:Membrane-associated protein n=1 Tax=Nonomuraea soli TaxID=1032476 RepID=A0A7W0CJ64_9ACTN|nr:VTT domain-containing protein [Nonomuraea soli]MBA2892182.1 membrane-associated protein [Nonomuraea soli]